MGETTQSTIGKVVSLAIQIANDNSHGYSQASRWGPDYDCSSLVISAWQQAGVPVKASGATYTGNMYAAFTRCGFKDVTAEVNLGSGAGMQPGDVLLNHASHTAMYIGNGQVVHARSSEGNSIPGDQSGNEIRVQGYWNFPWDCVLRYMGGGESEATASAQEPATPESAKRRVLRKGMTGEDVRELQEKLTKLGYDTGGVDGDFGKKTFIAVVAFQEDHGLEVDGVAGPATMSLFESIIDADAAKDTNVPSSSEQKEAVTTMRGVDISTYQQGLTIQQLKDAGMGFAIIKVTEGSHLVDGAAFDFYSQAYSMGFPLGAYCYSHATTINEAMAEGAFLVKTLNGFPMPCGVYLDIEEPSMLALSKDQLLDVIRGWCAAIGGAGYVPGLYGSEGNLWAKVSPSDLPSGTLVWVAKWSSTQPHTVCDLWQTSDSGRIGGYNGSVDTDVSMSDRFVALASLGYDKVADDTESTTAPSTDEEGLPIAKTWPPRVIQKGKCTGWPEVWLLQSLLDCRGFNVVPDGIFGDSLEQKVITFQKAAFPGKPSEWDGIVGPKTWAALFGAEVGVVESVKPEAKKEETKPESFWNGILAKIRKS